MERAAQAAPRLRPSRRERQGAPAKECPLRGARAGRQACRRFRDSRSRTAFGGAYSEFVHVPAAAGWRGKELASLPLPTRHGMNRRAPRTRPWREGACQPAAPTHCAISFPSPPSPFLSPFPPPRALCGRTAAAGTPALPLSTDHRHAASEGRALPGGAIPGT